MSVWTSQRVMEAIGAGSKAGLRMCDVRSATGLDAKSVENSLLKLFQRGLISRPKDLSRGHGYQLTSAGRAFLDEGRRITSGPNGPQPGKRLHRGTLRERAWSVMRTYDRKPFSLRDLLFVIDDGRMRDATSNIGKYLRQLTRAGYLTQLRSRERADTMPESNGFKRYHLARDTGPQAPRYRPRHRTVWDPNTEEELAASPLPSSGTEEGGPR